tara:strand:- start:62701 stop:63501 length:801 start_codon:yes stop_codon:yes gene_type:complete
MSVSISNKLVTRGLELYLDSANPKSFVPGNTSFGGLPLWNSIGTTNQVNLEGGNSFNNDFAGVINFDGVDGTTSRSRFFYPSIRNGDEVGETVIKDFELTFEMVFRLLETVPSGTPTNLFRTTASSSGVQMLPLYRTTAPADNNFISSAGYKNVGGTKQTLFSINEYEINKWYHVTMSMRKTSPTTGEWLLLINGNVIEHSTLNDIDFWGNYSELNINELGNQIESMPNTNYFSHDKAIIRVYRKGLTLDECLQNYRVLKKRFKLN